VVNVLYLHSELFYVFFFSVSHFIPGSELKGFAKISDETPGEKVVKNNVRS
jgi:hypothetical protein